MDEVAARIRQARHDAGLSRELLAGTIGVSLPTLVRYETGRSGITVYRLFQIAEATGKPAGWFLETDGIAA